jgi:hypothetical protein
MSATAAARLGVIRADPAGGGEGTARGGDVGLVTRAQLRRLGSAGQERGRRGGVGVGERAVEQLRLHRERTAAGRDGVDEIGPAADPDHGGDAGQDPQQTEHHKVRGEPTRCRVDPLRESLAYRGRVQQRLDPRRGCLGRLPGQQRHVALINASPADIAARQR